LRDDGGTPDNGANDGAYSAQYVPGKKGDGIYSFMIQTNCLNGSAWRKVPGLEGQPQLLPVASFRRDNRVSGYLLGTPANLPPIAKSCHDVKVECAGDQTLVSVDGSCSSDPEGESLTYHWSTPAGSMIVDNAAIGIGSFPLGRTRVSLEVKDGYGNTSLAPAKTLVIVSDSGVPTLTGPAKQRYQVCASVRDGVDLVPPTVSDTCSTTALTASVIARDGVPLTSPIPVVDGHVSLGEGVYTVEWRATDSTGNASTFEQTVEISSAIRAQGLLSLKDGAKVVSGTGFASLTNGGSGLTSLGVEAQGGELASAGTIELRDRSRVHGSVRSASTVQIMNDVFIEGSVSNYVNDSIPAPLALNVSVPPSQGDRSLEPGTTLALSPGSYGTVSIKSRSKLVLQAGTYYFRNLQIEPHAKVTASTGAVQMFITTQLIYRGSMKVPGGLSLGYLGTQSIFLEAPLKARIVAPDAEVVVRRTLAGTLSAKDITIDPHLVVTCLPGAL
jgi:hypothetical protein